MAALAICAVTAALLRDRTDTQAPEPVRPDQSPPADPGMIPLTVPEIKRLLAGTSITPRPAGRPQGLLERLAAPPPGTLPLVPQARQTRPRRRDHPGQLANGGCRTRGCGNPWHPAASPASVIPERKIRPGSALLPLHGASHQPA